MQRGSFSIVLGTLALAIATYAAASEFSLYDAAKAGDVEQVRRLIAEGAEVNLSYRSDAPLHAAVATGRLEVAELLLAAGADPNLRGFTGTPLHLASAGGHLALVKLLVDDGADVNALSTFGTTPLFLAAQNGHLEVAVALLAEGADVNLRGNAYRPPPLVGAVRFGRLELVRLLIDAGARIDWIDPTCGQTALHISVMNTDEAVTRDLLDAGADPTVRDQRGETPLTLAQQRGDGPLVGLLTNAVARQ